MATRLPVPGPRRKARHQRNPQWRRDRRPRPPTASLEDALALIPTLPRSLLCRLTDRMIERLDEMDGDADAEPDGDEADGNFAEDDCCTVIRTGPGCPLDDPGGAGWLETHGKGAPGGAGWEEDEEPRHVPADMIHFYEGGQA